MLAAERQAMIVELIRENGSVQVDELARELNVSSMTIRRDLVKLENSNMIERCHGGAVAKQEVAYEKKQTSNKKSKAAIAGKCAEFVHPGDSVFLDAGTTTCEIAKRICDIPDIIARFKTLEQEEKRERSEQSFMVPKAEIVANGYDLSINKYKKVEYVAEEYPPSSEILAEIRSIETEISKGLDDLEAMLK